MKKLLLPVVLTAFLSVSSDAASSYRSIAIKLADETTTKIKLENDVAVAIKDGALSMECSKGTISYPVDQIQNWTFSTDPGSDSGWAGIDGIVSDDANVVLTLDGGVLGIEGLRPATAVMVVGIDGRLFKTIKADCTGSLSISLDSLAKGIYVVSYNNQSMKFAVK